MRRQSRRAEHGAPVARAGDSGSEIMQHITRGLLAEHFVVDARLVEKFSSLAHLHACNVTDAVASLGCDS